MTTTEMTTTNAPAPAPATETTANMNATEPEGTITAVDPDAEAGDAGKKKDKEKKALTPSGALQVATKKRKKAEEEEARANRDAWARETIAKLTKQVRVHKIREAHYDTILETTADPETMKRAMQRLAKITREARCEPGPPVDFGPLLDSSLADGMIRPHHQNAGVADAESEE